MLDLREEFVLGLLACASFGPQLVVVFPKPFLDCKNLCLLRFSELPDRLLLRPWKYQPFAFDPVCAYILSEARSERPKETLACLRCRYYFPRRVTGRNAMHYLGKANSGMVSSPPDGAWRGERVGSTRKAEGGIYKGWSKRNE